MDRRTNITSEDVEASCCKGGVFATKILCTSWRLSRSCRSTQIDREDRKGITLFEVVLALAIFLGATAVIGQVLQNGSRAATRAQLTGDAAVRCERKMNEVLSGVLPLSAENRAPFEDSAAWVWTVNVLDSEVIGLLKVEVIVEHLSSRGDVNNSFQLTRLVRDPQIYEEAAIIPDEEL
ncbi:hypothetical protein [Thalassoglobus polymorphus]|uniref:Bacterial type II secretion system protein I/J n=1 Tax=Thalassoglobus polymorphus TaxID=2527994 RepID=A0A517QMH9_9PLAN|nr:hypothetical protein [Thalassoglobus polymorphus]QDT32849.1 hypothetical protein Mal48_20970 [Thalassoglobus polymorphus]